MKTQLTFVASVCLALCAGCSAEKEIESSFSVEPKVAIASFDTDVQLHAKSLAEAMTRHADGAKEWWQSITIDGETYRLKWQIADPSSAYKGFPSLVAIDCNKQKSGETLSRLFRAAWSQQQVKPQVEIDVDALFADAVNDDGNGTASLVIGDWLFEVSVNQYKEFGGERCLASLAWRGNVLKGSEQREFETKIDVAR